MSETQNPTVHPVILSGGAGTRLWPMSRKAYPKQLLPLETERTMLQETALRVAGGQFSAPTIVCNDEHRFIVAEQLRGMGYGVALNDPFKGVELVRMVGAPDQGRHSLQIEINRNLILNDRSKEKVAEFETLRANLTKLIGAIGEFATSEANSS